MAFAFQAARRGYLVLSPYTESIRGNAVRMIVEPASQFAVGDSAMSLDPFSLAADRFTF